MEIWMVSAELVAKTEDNSPAKIGFMNITTWADSKGRAEAKIQKYLQSRGWRLVSVEKSHIVSETGQYGEME
jgi:hypothetical protein